jgi:four helix bundle protein
LEIENGDLITITSIRGSLFSISSVKFISSYFNLFNNLSMKPHQKLEVWKQSFNLVKKLYEFTSPFPVEEKFGLTSQIRRAGTSIPVNIAEGCARKSDKELLQFLYISLGSASELDTLLLLSKELGFINFNSCDVILNDLDSIFKLLLGFINTVKKRVDKNRK